MLGLAIVCRIYSVAVVTASKARLRWVGSGVSQTGRLGVSVAVGSGVAQTGGVIVGFMVMFLIRIYGSGLWQ